MKALIIDLILGMFCLIRQLRPMLLHILGYHKMLMKYWYVCIFSFILYVDSWKLSFYEPVIMTQFPYSNNWHLIWDTDYACPSSSLVISPTTTVIWILKHDPCGVTSHWLICNTNIFPLISAAKSCVYRYFRPVPLMYHWIMIIMILKEVIPI